MLYRAKLAKLLPRFVASDVCHSDVYRSDVCCSDDGRYDICSCIIDIIKKIGHPRQGFYLWDK